MPAQIVLMVPLGEMPGGLPGWPPGAGHLPAPQPPYYPDQGLPPGSPGHPDVGLPVEPGHPDVGLPVPPGGIGQLPSPVPPYDDKVVVAVHRPGQGWTVKSYEPGQGGGRPDRPDQGLPRPPGRPDQGLPGGGGRPDQGLPPLPQPKPAGG